VIAPPPLHPSLPLVLTRIHRRTGELFAQSPYKPTKANPNGGCEAVLDSSRYFVLTVVDATSGQKAYVGMGFPERTESFDFNVALQVRTSSGGAFAFAGESFRFSSILADLCCCIQGTSDALTYHTFDLLAWLTSP
jgi:hypothetical protein